MLKDSNVLINQEDQLLLLVRLLGDQGVGGMTSSVSLVLFVRMVRASPSVLVKSAAVAS